MKKKFRESAIKTAENPTFFWFAHIAEKMPFSSLPQSHDEKSYTQSKK